MTVPRRSWSRCVWDGCLQNSSRRLLEFCEKHYAESNGPESKQKPRTEWRPCPQCGRGFRKNLEDRTHRYCQFCRKRLRAGLPAVDGGGSVRQDRSEWLKAKDRAAYGIDLWDVDIPVIE